MICTAIYDKNEKNRKTLRDWITEYLMQQEMDMDVLWLTKEIIIEKLCSLSYRMQIAFISLEDGFGVSLGKMLYSVNPECRIIYYASKDYDIKQLLSTRPIGYYLLSEGKQQFFSVFSKVFDEMRSSINVFSFETRGEIHFIPMRQILYLQSDLKYAIIHTLNGESKLYSKLSPLEKKLSNDFVRIHKSFIVNSAFVSCISKKEHTVLLKNGEVLPISAVNYDSSLDKFRKLNLV